MAQTKLKITQTATDPAFGIRVCNFLETQGIGVSNFEYAVFPGFCDVHVHFREPGFSYKETVATGCASAARGGYTAVCTMPNLNPAPDTLEHLNLQRQIIEEDACIHVYPYGTITMGELGEELADLEAMAPFVCGFSDDGRGVQSDDMMRAAMEKAKKLGKMIVAHCEVNDLLRGGYIHDGQYAKAHGHRGICSESEWVQIDRDLKLVEQIGCAYHVCHISTKESVDIIRKAKARGLEKSAFGVVGLETAFAAMYTHLVKPGIITLERLVELLADNPRKRFGIPLGLDFSVWDLNTAYTVDPEEFQSMGRATPFAGMELYGRCLLTVCDGKVVWQENQ